MRIDRFQMERTQCLYENDVDFNLSESGVQPLTARELLTSDAGREAFLNVGLKYSQSNGTPELREHIASFYPGATASNVLVTTGTSEANFSTLWGLLDKTGRAAIMIPNYLQGWGLARAYAARADAYRLVEREENGVQRWALDIESLRKAVTKRTKLILVTNPNNPTGAVLTAAEMDEIIRLARKAGAWIVADEVYRGAEVASDRLTPTFWGRYSKVIVTAGLSKAFGMPGLRVGWIVGPERQSRICGRIRTTRHSRRPCCQIASRVSPWSPCAGRRSSRVRGRFSTPICRSSSVGFTPTMTSAASSGRSLVRSCS